MRAPSLSLSSSPPLYLPSSPLNSIPNTMHHCGGASSFSAFLSVPNHGGGGAHEMVDTYSNHSSSSSSSSVDCTLSLGTPSTRSSEFDSDQRAAAASRHHRRSAGSYVSNFCWDLLHPKQKSSGRSGTGGDSAAVGSVGDPLLARRCANCDTTSTPLWRNGPRGPKSLCNACGIRFKKEERRAAATTTSTAVNITAATTTSTAVNITAAESNSHHMNSATTWVPHHSSPLTSQKLPCVSTAAAAVNIGNDNVRRTETENGMSSFLSWRLNVTDHRPSLVHDFTR